jgi:class 3 adenylate cyclase
VVPLEGEPIAALHQLAITLAGNAELDMLLRQALLIAARLTDSSHATILLLDERGERIRARATLDSDNVAPLEMVAGPMMRRGLAGWVARERRTALVRDTEQDPRWLPGPGLGDLRSAIVAPLLLDDVVLGLLTLGHAAPEHYVDLHAQLVEIIGALLIAAIRRPQTSAPGRLEAPHASRGVLTRPSPSIQQIIALSAEMRGMVAASGQLPPHVFFDEVLRAIFQELSSVVQRHGGVVDAIAGAALLAIFDARAGAAPAVRAALAMQSAAQRQRAHWRAHLHIEVAGLDIGIACGPAIVGWMGVGSGATRVGEVVGQAVRLRELAGGGETFVSSAIAVALRDDDAFALVPLPPLRIESPALQRIFRVGPPHSGWRSPVWT